MSETAVLPEMIEAGVETLVECRHANANDRTAALMVYLAMEAVRQISEMRDMNETRH